MLLLAGALLVVLLAATIVLVTASPARADRPLGGSSTVPTTTTAAPRLVQPTLTFSWDGLRFTDVVLVDIPKAPLPGFFLRLSPSSQTIKCAATALARSPKYDGGVNSFSVVCDATTLPSAYTPTLEVFVPGAPSTFVPVTLINISHRNRDQSLPFVVGAVLAVVALAWVVLWLRHKDRMHSVMDQVAADVSWSISDSWVTNVGVVGGLLTTVAAATSGSLSGALPGVPSPRIEVLSVTFVAMLALGPLIYGVCAKKVPEVTDASQVTEKINITIEDDGTTTPYSTEIRPIREAIDITVGGTGTTSRDNTDTSQAPATTRGTVGGVFLLSLVTLIAVFGELTTLWTLVDLSTADSSIRDFLQRGLWLGRLVVFIYSIRSITLLVEGAGPPKAGADKPRGRSLLSHGGPVAAAL